MNYFIEYVDAISPVKVILTGVEIKSIFLTITKCYIKCVTDVSIFVNISHYLKIILSYNVCKQNEFVCIHEYKFKSQHKMFEILIEEH